MSWNLIGHAWAEKILRQHLKNGDVHHAYLFTGAPGVGRRSLALEFAKAINCTNPPDPGNYCGTCNICRHIAAMQQADLHVISSDTEGGMIKVDQMRELQRSLILTPYEARYRIALLLNFHRANANAQNALLKTLEEAPAKVILLLTADSAESLLPTISSRCEILRLRPVSIETLASALVEQHQLPPEKAALYAHIANGRPGIALRLGSDPKTDEKRTNWIGQLQDALGYSIQQKLKLSENLNKEKNAEPLGDILKVWTSFVRDILLIQAGKPAGIVNIDYDDEISALANKVSREDLLRFLKELTRSLDLVEINANPRLMIDNLFLNLPVLQ